jgi:hypothetical protein
MSIHAIGLGRLGLVLTAALAAGTSACLVPPFSSLDDARLAGKGKVELTPFYSAIGGSSDGESSHTQDDLGVQGFLGIARRVDIGVRYEYLHHSASGEYDSDASAHTLAMGPKLSLRRDRLALSLPVGFAFGEDVDTSGTWKIIPTVVWTLPAAEALDVNLSAKALVSLRKNGGRPLYAVNLGLGIRPGDHTLVIRPEVGGLFSSGGGGFNYHLSLGLSYRFGL